MSYFPPNEFITAIPVHLVKSSLPPVSLNRRRSLVELIFIPPTNFFQPLLCGQLIVLFPPDTKIKGVQGYMSYFPPYEFITVIPVHLVKSSLPPGSLNRSRSLVELIFFPLRIFFSHSCEAS